MDSTEDTLDDSVTKTEVDMISVDRNKLGLPTNELVLSKFGNTEVLGEITLVDNCSDKLTTPVVDSDISTAVEIGVCWVLREIVIWWDVGDGNDTGIDKLNMTVVGDGREVERLVMNGDCERDGCILSVTTLDKVCTDCDGLYSETCVEDESSGVVDNMKPDVLLRKGDID